MAEELGLGPKISEEEEKCAAFLAEYSYLGDLKYMVQLVSVGRFWTPSADCTRRKQAD